MLRGASFSRGWGYILLCYLLTGALAAQATGDPPPLSCAHAKLAAARASAAFDPASAWSGARAAAAEAATDTDVLHYDLRIELDPITRWMDGSNTMTIRSEVDGLATFTFRLHPVYTITSMNIYGTPVNWIRPDNASVEVTLDRLYARDEVLALHVAYEGVAPAPDSWGGIRFRSRGGAREIYTLSEPWYAYMWWPGKHELTDKTTADLRFTVPNTIFVASNGVLLAVDDVGNGRLRYHWQTQYQTDDYLYSIAATNFNQFGVTWEYGDRSMPVVFFIYPEHDTPEHRDAWLVCVPALTTFSDLFGLYPFVNEKYGMAQFGWGGGMEHQTLTSIVGNFSWEDGIVHELAHQWWGDAVTCATWHDIWLNEGFASYAEALWYEFEPGSSGAPALHQAMATQRPYDVAGSVYCYDADSVGRIFDYDLTYLKAAWVLHMLRYVVGDQAFFDLLAAYRAASENGTATTADFQAVAESVASRDLDWFFNPWVYGSGAPAYSYGWTTRLVDGVTYIEMYLEQAQEPAFDTFTMPIEVRTTESDGQHTYFIWNDARVEHLLFRVDGPVSQLVIDPTPWILWTLRQEQVFIDGPPKIVTMWPPPNAAVRPGDVPFLEVVFQEDVAADPGSFTLVGDHVGPASFAYSYDQSRFAVRLTPSAALVPDRYTLVVSDTLEDVAEFPLDGELVKPDGPNLLPSGDGLPGGAASAVFLVTAGGDMNCDGGVNLADINPFVLALTSPAMYALQFPGCPLLSGDVNEDGSLDFGDINSFVALLSGS